MVQNVIRSEAMNLRIFHVFHFWRMSSRAIVNEPGMLRVCNVFAFLPFRKRFPIDIALSIFLLTEFFSVLGKFVPKVLERRDKTIGESFFWTTGSGLVFFRSVEFRRVWLFLDLAKKDKS